MEPHPLRRDLPAPSGLRSALTNGTPHGVPFHVSRTEQTRSTNGQDREPCGGRRPRPLLPSRRHAGVGFEGIVARPILLSTTAARGTHERPKNRRMHRGVRHVRLGVPDLRGRLPRPRRHGRVPAALRRVPGRVRPMHRAPEARIDRALRNLRRHVRAMRRGVRSPRVAPRPLRPLRESLPRVRRRLPRGDRLSPKDPRRFPARVLFPEATGYENRRRRSELRMTETELNAIAPAANIGLSQPRAAIGIITTL